MKVVINECYGGFSLSQEAWELYKNRGGTAENEMDICYRHDNYRNDPILVSVVEDLREAADGRFAELAIAVIPDEYDYWIEEYDGWESIRLDIKEDHLRKLIRAGDEEAIVKYVMFNVEDLVKFVGEDDEDE
jgi:hypothetical protein